MKMRCAAGDWRAFPEVLTSRQRKNPRVAVAKVCTRWRVRIAPRWESGICGPIVPDWCTVVHLPDAASAASAGAIDEESRCYVQHGHDVSLSRVFAMEHGAVYIVEESLMERSGSSSAADRAAAGPVGHCSGHDAAHGQHGGV
eukprot:NODE_1303_length_1596_cov_42.373626_g1168_i0.p3 GENE.NODE_1303_length_1596_cov_42.373626_g1168_i0~~NODE_1303_length_1596_cov_42.373626_g1168_i0.p3  ORF type:complete len:143 (+),score=15.78 NODE_1303_length_1596_cov_42.373626_g1168_i0:289-717(+)